MARPKFILMGHLWGKGIAEDDIKLRSDLGSIETFIDTCDSCCKKKPLVALVRSLPTEDVWLDMVCQYCLDRLLGVKE